MSDNKRLWGVALSAALGASLLSAGGVLMIQKHEGTGPRQGVLYASYPDPGTGGYPWTICYGHTKGVRPGMTATQAQCQQWLREDLLVAEKAVQKRVRVSLTQNEYDAYVSFVFNAGEQNFANSTMLRYLNQGKRREACNQFPRWVYADKRKLRGLEIRRFEEQALCLKPSKVVYYAR